MTENLLGRGKKQSIKFSDPPGPDFSVVAIFLKTILWLIYGSF